MVVAPLMEFLFFSDLNQLMDSLWCVAVDFKDTVAYQQEVYCVLKQNTDVAVLYM